MDFVNLSNLHFGKTTAEAEVDKLALEEYFVTTPAYINAKNDDRRKTYYVGKRGAGKSALLSKLALDFQADDKNIILKINPLHFSYELFKKREHEHQDVKYVYAAVWQYTLVTQIFKIVVEYFRSRPNLKTNKDNVSRLTSYLTEKGLLEENFMSAFEIFLHEANTEKARSRIKKSFNHRDRNEVVISDFLTLSSIGAELRCLQKITASHPIYIFIDELDTGWDKTKEAQNFIYGLFLSIRELKKLSGLKFFVSLRADMYGDLNHMLPDPEKMRDDIERFSWNEKLLKFLIANRIRLYSKPSSMNDREIINDVFEEGVLEYIVSRSLLTPREVIQFCNKTVEKLSNYVYDDEPLRPTKIDLQLVKQVEPRHSKDRFDEFYKEYMHQYPFLDLLLKRFESGAEYYVFEEFKTRLEDAILYVMDKVKERIWLHDYLDNTDNLIELLFNIGFVKLYSEEHQKYMAYYESSFLNIEDVKKLKIHEVFKAILKCN